MRQSSRSVVSVLCAAFLAACSSTVASVRDPERAAAARDASEWLAAAKHPFDAQAPRAAMQPALLAALEGAQAIGIGEASHGNHEDALFKSELILALFDAGRIDTLYVEANREGVEALERAVQDPQADMRTAVSNAAIFRVIKTEGFLHVMSGLQERSRSGMPVRVVGIDCQATTPDALFALERLAARDAATAAQLREELELVVGEKARGMRHPELVRGLDTQQLERYIKVLERLEAACAGDARAVDAARRARQGLESFRLEASDAKPEEASMEDWSLRDRFMAENLLADGSHRGVFWGHNVHVFGGRPNGQLEGYRPSGSFLREALGSRYRVVLFDYVTAEIRAVPVPTDGSQPDATQPTAVFKREVLPAALAAELDG
ncbi:MAG: erythromycin esterase family protein, partial [Planctomycetota bacterium]